MDLYGVMAFGIVDIPRASPYHGPLMSNSETQFFHPGAPPTRQHRSRGGRRVRSLLLVSLAALPALRGASLDGPFSGQWGGGPRAIPSADCISPVQRAAVAEAI